MHGPWCEDIFLVDLRFGVTKKDGGWVKMMRRVKTIENGGDWACTWIDVGIYCMRGFNFKGSLSFWTSSRCVVPWGRGSQCQYSGSLVVKHGWKIIDDFCVWLPAISLNKRSPVAQVAQVLSSSIGLPPRKGTQKHQSVGISLGSLGPPWPGRQGLQSARGQQPGGPGAEDWSHWDSTRGLSTMFDVKKFRG